MASSLPHDVAGSKAAISSAGRRLHILTTGEALAPAHHSEETLIINSRKRATTETNANLLGSRQSLLDRRFKGLKAVLSLDLTDTRSAPENTYYPPRTQPESARPSVPDGYKSAPIDIPIRKPPSSQPTTPLTGREPPERSFFKYRPEYSHTPPENTNRQNLTPSPDTKSESSQSERESFIQSPITQRSMRLGRGVASPLDTPSPRLSPTTPLQSIPVVTQSGVRPPFTNKRSRQQPGTLAIPSLPAFHPANYESRTSAPRTSRPTSSSHGHQLSDAQKKLQQHQHDLVVNYTRNAVRNNGKSPVPQPSSPRLSPLGSSGPITPLMLEGQSDYFLAGSRKGSKSASKAEERREIVERMIGLEKERIRQPGRVERGSPAVSPAGGPG
ncbi:MAG: hypothetical protein Q9224_001260 [Gallowayella concinna]